MKFRMREDALEGRLVNEMRLIESIGETIKSEIGNAFCRDIDQEEFRPNTEFLSTLFATMHEKIKSVRVAANELEEFSQTYPSESPALSPSDREFHLEEVRDAREKASEWEDLLTKLCLKVQH